MGRYIRAITANVAAAALKPAVAAAGAGHVAPAAHAAAICELLGAAAASSPEIRGEVVEDLFLVALAELVRAEEELAIADAVATMGPDAIGGGGRHSAMARVISRVIPAMAGCGGWVPPTRDELAAELAAELGS